jgi:hypothetical protein
VIHLQGYGVLEGQQFSYLTLAAAPVSWEVTPRNDGAVMVPVTWWRWIPTPSRRE